MGTLAEWYESGNAPHEALGRAARRLASGGALYLGGGVGVERQQTGQGAATYKITTAEGEAKGEAFDGPLSAVIRAFSAAGSSTRPDTPGGSTSISDPAVAARLRELNEAESEAKADLRRFETRLRRRQSRPRPFSPGAMAVEDDNWEARRIEELRADLSRISSERKRLIATGKIEERAETGKPGTNWKQVTPEANARLSGLKAHYAKMAHPFTQCVLDNTKRFGKERAERVCAVLKDLIRKTTKWRKGGGGKVSEEVDALLAAALGRIVVVEEELGLGASVALVEADVALLPAQAGALAEGLALDYALLALAGHPLAEVLFPAPEEQEVAEREEPASEGVGMLLEAFGPPPVATAARGDAVRTVAAKKKKKTGETAKSKSGSSGSKYDESKHKRASGGAAGGGRYITTGSSGEDVRAVQRKVGAKTDGKYGSKTAQAVKDYQKRHGLKVDGVVGRQTSLAMRGHYRTAKKTAPGAMHKNDSEALKKMRRGSKGRSGKTGPRARGGVTV